jgi:hypothetical protein
LRFWVCKYVYHLATLFKCLGLSKECDWGPKSSEKFIVVISLGIKIEQGDLRRISASQLGSSRIPSKRVGNLSARLIRFERNWLERIWSRRSECRLCRRVQKVAGWRNWFIMKLYDCAKNQT